MNDYNRNNCSIDVARTLVDLMPADFNKTINIYLPKENVVQSVLFSFDQYSNLKNKRNIMESAHIPSYKALEVCKFIN